MTAAGEREVRGRRGFTLVETMVAASIGVLVLAMVMAPFISAQRMLRTARAEAELSLAMRELRDKLLFKASPDISGNHYGGLLSGMSLNESDVKGGTSVEMSGHTVGATLGNTADSSIRLLVWQVGDCKMLINERTPDKDNHVRWLWPGSFELVKKDSPGSGVTTMSEILEYDPQNGSNIYRLYFDIGLKADVNGDKIVRWERVTVPVFGKIQPMTSVGEAGEKY